MIHDIILSLLSEKESNVIRELTNLELTTNFLHPAEVDTLKNINKITFKYREIRKFISMYRTCCNESTKIALSLSDKRTLPPGLYLQAFANGLDKSIDSYRQSVTCLEKQYLRESGFGLMFILHEVEKFRPLFEFLLRMIHCVIAQTIHGCQFLQYLHDNALHGDKSITRSVYIIQKSVYTVFIQQLCQWLKYGKFVDNYGEFFIANVEVSSDQATGNNPSSNPSFQSSDTSSELVDIWTYEINYNSLPIYFSKSWAEKVFFIGQTVLMFNSDVTNNVDRDQDKLLKQTIWHEHEQKFFGKFIELQQRDHFSVVSFEQIVDEIKCYVTERLSLILVKDSDLVKHLKLLRDFYLLGRGELYCELIKSLDEFHTDKLTENTIKELNRIFHKTATSVNIPDVLELFTLDTYKGEVEESFSLNPNKPKPVLNVLTLKYNVKWPLHLLFSPKVLENYNDLFRFMMKIKKNQQNLYAVWHHHRQEKIAINNKLFEFRNNLMFFIDNLQYYLQVEVVESQYSIMMKKIEERNDFEQIQKAHNCFLANVLSLCFMLENTEHSMILSRSMGLSSESQVFIIINNILKLIENFTGFAFICSDPMTEKEDESFRKFGILFNREIEALLMKLRNLQGSAPVAQLLLRLDFNYYFSSQIDKREEENEPESIEQLIY